LTLHTHRAYGCRYNVREVGFIDIGIEPYHLFMHLPENTSEAEVAELSQTMGAALLDTNVRFESLVAGADANHAAMKLFVPDASGKTPTSILVSPDGQSMPLPAGQTVVTALEDILQSPTRREILDKAAQSYGVVLLIEGPEPARNAEARDVISTALGHIAEQLEFLPKAIARPPELVTLEQQSLGREEVLLWSFGLKARDVNEPHAAVFYGRGRWIGPLFKGEMLTADNVAQLLFVIGSDCECGLDHRWLQGTMLPARWDERLQQKVVESLGFDPENPMVKMEMVSIIRRGMGGFDTPGVPFGYQEIEIGGEESEGLATGAAASIVEPAAPSATPVQRTMPAVGPPTPQEMQDHGQTTPTVSYRSFTVLAVSLGAMTALVVAASAVIVARARRR
jgi:hypothetical protein